MCFLNNGSLSYLTNKTCYLCFKARCNGPEYSSSHKDCRWQRFNLYISNNISLGYKLQ